MASSNNSNLRPFGSKLQDKQVLIFGGSSGIGFGIAQGAVEAGSYVYISSSSQAKIDRALDKLRKAYPEAASKVAGSAIDLRDADSLVSAYQSLFDKIGRPVDHIAFTAGDALAIAPLAELTPDNVIKAGAVRFVAPIFLAQVAMQPGRMNLSADSSITLTSGTNGAKPMKNWSMLAGYGSGVEGLARGLAVDMAPLRVNAVSPGAIDTELFGSIPADQIDAVMQGFAKATTVGRVGRPHDVAEAYLYIMRDGFCSGQVVSSDGGRLIA